MAYDAVDLPYLFIQVWHYVFMENKDYLTQTKGQTVCLGTFVRVSFYCTEYFCGFKVTGRDLGLMGCDDICISAPDYICTLKQDDTVSHLYMNSQTNSYETSIDTSGNHCLPCRSEFAAIARSKETNLLFI